MTIDNEDDAPILHKDLLPQQVFKANIKPIEDIVYLEIGELYRCTEIRRLTGEIILEHER